MIDLYELEPVQCVTVSALPLYGERHVIYALGGQEWIYFAEEWIQIKGDGTETRIDENQQELTRIDKNMRGKE